MEEYIELFKAGCHVLSTEDARSFASIVSQHEHEFWKTNDTLYYDGDLDWDHHMGNHCYGLYVGETDE